MSPVFGHQKKATDQEENDQGDIGLGIHSSAVVRFMIVFHIHSLDLSAFD